MPQRQEAELRRLQRVKSTPPGDAPPLGQDMVAFFKQSVQKRQKKFGAVAESWSRLIPEFLNDHCCLESFSRGALVVLVDSSPHLYELRQLLLAGTQQQLLLACKSAGLRKITFKQGRWYDGDEKRLSF